MQFFSHDIEKKLQKYLEVVSKLESKNKACMKFQQSICKKESIVPYFNDILSKKDGSSIKKKKTGSGTTPKQSVNASSSTPVDKQSG